jgi:hypothetical protein
MEAVWRGRRKTFDWQQGFCSGLQTNLKILEIIQRDQVKICCSWIGIRSEHLEEFLFLHLFSWVEEITS